MSSSPTAIAWLWPAVPDRRQAGLCAQRGNRGHGLRLPTLIRDEFRENDGGRWEKEFARKIEHANPELTIKEALTHGANGVVYYNAVMFPMRDPCFHY